MNRRLSIRVAAVLSSAIAVAIWNGTARAEHTQHRAGHPECVASYAQPSETPRYSGSYVGGGTAFKGCGRQADEGTWGWDYCGYGGRILSHHPWLNWSHGRRCQDGGGAYKTDGPHVPDPVGRLRF